MTQLPAGTGMAGTRSKPALDIYGVMVIIATAFVAAALGFVIFKTVTLLGTPLPIPGD